MASNGAPPVSQSPVAIITGGASGMGLAVAQDLTAKGWNLTILDLNEQSLESVKPNFDTSCTNFIKVDVTDYEQQADAFVQTWNRWGRLDVSSSIYTKLVPIVPSVSTLSSRDSNHRPLYPDH